MRYKTLWERWPKDDDVPGRHRSRLAKALVFDNRDDVPGALVQQAQELFAEAPPSVVEDRVSEYLDRIDQHFKAHNRFAKSLPLNVAVGGGDGAALPAQQSLTDWLTKPGSPRICFLTGEPGSGKTYLLDWLGSHVSRRALGDSASPVPVALSLGRTGTRPPADKRALRSCCEHEPPDGFLSKLPDQQALLLLDGLDQSRNIELDLKPEAYVNLIDGLDRLFGRRARIVITCRSVDLERLRGHIESRMKIRSLSVLPVDERLVDEHFASTEAAAQWSRWRSVPEVQKWPRTPFNIRLLELALLQAGARSTGDLISALRRRNTAVAARRPRRLLPARRL
ncbi:MAG: NACHT domain-containing protein [Polyangiaceae bacterium]